MSGCSCSDPRELRVSGEVWANGSHIDTIGGGEKAVRVRCAHCGGKVGRIGSDVLTRLFGIPESEIVNGRCLDVDEQRSLEVDLI
jgi:hypothetical protein